MLTNLSIGSYGRWGNMVYQIAAVIGIARASGQDYGFAPIINHDHRDRFGSTEDVDLDKYFLNPLPKIDGRQFTERHCMWGYHDVYLPAGDWDLRGHFQSAKYWLPALDEIRYHLTMVDEYEPTEAVAIHYRAGDYESNGAASYHPRCSPEYYEQAIKQFPANTLFYIFSDDIKEAVSIIKPFASRILVSRDEHYMEDFKLMKSCHSFICANSSMSAAAALLSNQPGKKIIMPNRWFGDPAGGLKMDYPENCIVI